MPGDIEAELMTTARVAKLAAPLGPATLASSATAFAKLLEEATLLATTERRADVRPLAPLIAIDQGEELFTAENAAESDRFLELVAALLNSTPEDVDPYFLMTIRADSLEPLLQRWPTLYRDIITKPAEVFSELVQRLTVEPALADRLAADTNGGDALPLLLSRSKSYLRNSESMETCRSSTTTRWVVLADRSIARSPMHSVRLVRPARRRTFGAFSCLPLKLSNTLRPRRYATVV